MNFQHPFSVRISDNDDVVKTVVPGSWQFVQLQLPFFEQQNSGTSRVLSTSGTLLAGLRSLWAMQISIYLFYPFTNTIIFFNVDV